MVRSPGGRDSPRSRAPLPSRASAQRFGDLAGCQQTPSGGAWRERRRPCFRAVLSLGRMPWGFHPGEEMPLGLVPVPCPYGHRAQGITGGQTETSKQRERCQPTTCSHRSCVLEPAYTGRCPQGTEQIMAMALHGRGIRETARVLQSSPPTVMNARKKSVVAAPGQPASPRLLGSR